MADSGERRLGDGGSTRVYPGTVAAQVDNDEPVIWGRGAQSARRGRPPSLPPLPLPRPLESDPGTPVFGTPSKDLPAAPMESPRDIEGKIGANKISSGERRVLGSPPRSPRPGADWEDLRLAVREEMQVLLQVNRELIAQQHREQLRDFEQRLRGCQTFAPKATDAAFAQLSPVSAMTNAQTLAAGDDDNGRDRQAGLGSRRPAEGKQEVGMEVFSDWLDYNEKEAEFLAGVGPLALKIEKTYEAFEDKYATLPEKRGLFARVVHSKSFEVMSGCVILLNTIYISTGTNATMEKAIKGESDTRIDFGEAAFLAWFTIELILKLAAQGMYFFTAKPDVLWNYFDTLLWALSAFLLAFSASGFNVSFLRVLRCLKLVRIIRTLHFLEFTKELRTMMESTVQSAPTLLWCLLIIFFFVLLFAIFFVQASSTTLLSEDGDLTDAQRGDLIANFGSVQTAVLSLLMVTTGGFDWQVMYQTLVPAGDHAAAALLFFVLFFEIAVWNVVTSIFVDKALQLAKPDAEKALLQKRKMELRDRHSIRRMMEKCDVDGSGRMSREEFIRLMSHSDFQSFLEDRGIEIKEAVTFFSMVAAAIGTDEVDLDVLASSCLRIRGFATGIDLNVLRYETRMRFNGISASIIDLRHTVDRLAKAMS
ncbi:unnamed protein product [Prorocentrum cordatum]|uniref:EF-hand domain-containing protein n=1 Tax=Prorocentrum cordatum TaxID=2364126 RepID=A0ABN9R5P0_9DINO|nr:unnamed protein product [Polarella glacialis]